MAATSKSKSTISQNLFNFETQNLEKVASPPLAVNPDILVEPLLSNINFSKEFMYKMEAKRSEK